MNMKRQLHTLYIKHDGQFKTLSKMALGQVIVKLIHLQKNGARLNTIQSELQSILTNPISAEDVLQSLQLLEREKKISAKLGKYYLTSEMRVELKTAEDENERLHKYVLKKYFAKAQSKEDDIRGWFQDTTIRFFETFSFEWFHQMTYKGKNVSNNVPNLKETLIDILNNAKGIVEEDKEWLKVQYNKFIDSEDINENLLFWQYGISMFASRLITARNYADEMSIDMFKDSRFILDTNILMILDLEGHELSSSLKTLEKVLKSLNIIPCYFGITREEYLRAMNHRKIETIKVFNNYTLPVLQVSDCPFIQTAIKRCCVKEEDLNRMFDGLMDMPQRFHEDLRIDKYEYGELNEVIEMGQNDTELKIKINEVFKKRTKKDKRENPLSHDAGMLRGAEFIRKADKSWVVTSDSSLKIFALENTLRDETELVVGLDVILGVMAINSGGVNIEASNFAPLFKNIIKYALVPQSSAFELHDLAFILSTDTKINDLPDEKVIEVAKEVKHMRISGVDEEQIALYLRRVIEGEKIGLMKDIQEVRDSEGITKSKMERIERERDVVLAEYRDRRSGELRDEYDRKLRNNRWLMIGIPVGVAAITFFTIKYCLSSTDTVVQYIVGCSVEVIFGLLPLLPINKRLVRKHSEYVNDINRLVEDEILELKNKALN